MSQIFDNLRKDLAEARRIENVLSSVKERLEDGEPAQDIREYIKRAFESAPNWDSA